MKRFLAVAALTCATALAAGCGRGPESSASEVPPATDVAAASVAVDHASPVAGAPPPSAPAAPADATLAAPGAPDFAVLYPGAVLDSPAVTASGTAGPGGMATYTTDADPDAVIAFHRARAETAGLSSAMAMNQGESRAYGAADPGRGATLQVVASATDAGPTSVQLSWSAGK